MYKDRDLIKLINDVTLIIVEICQTITNKL